MIPIISMRAKTDVLLILGVMAVLQAVLFGAALRRAPQLIPDFVIFYTAAQIVRQGDGERIYDLHLQRQVHDETMPDIRTFVLPFNYPAFVLPVLLPLSYLPYPVAYWLWVGLSFSLLIAVAMLPLDEAPRQSIRIGLTLAFPPAVFCLLLGQVVALLLFLFAAALALWQRGYPRSAGLVLGLALFKFQHVIPFLIILGLKRQGKVLQGTAASTAVLLAAFVGITGWEGLRDYAVLLSHFVSSTAAERTAIGLTPEMMPPIEMMPTARGFLALFLPSGLFLLVLTALVSGSLIWLAVRSWSEERLSLSFGAALTASFLSAFHGNVADLTLLLLPLTILAGQMLVQGATARLVIPIALFYLPLSYLLLLHYRLTSLLFLLGVVLLLVTSSLLSETRRSIPRMANP